MIEYTTGDINDESEALVNTVNCVGVMGRGIALQFKKAWPENFKAYAAACKRNEVSPGRMFVFETGQLTPPRYIINFPTKRHWRGKSRIEDIEAGLVALVEIVRKLGIKSIAVPPLGSGLDWTDVRARIERAMAALPDARVRVYESNGAQEPERIRPVGEAPRMTAGRAALVGLMKRYLGGLLDPSISLLEIHKLMYFLQEAGEPLMLRYIKAPYGPYAENLRHVLQAIEGYMVAGYLDGGDAPDKTLTLVPGAAEEADAFLRQHAGTRARFDRVSDLVEGFESPLGMELLATVHWLFTHEAPPRSRAEAIERTHAWNPGKRRVTPRQIGLAANVLAFKGWITPLQAEATA